MRYRYAEVYAFGNRPGLGNGAGVLPDARGLSEDDMQAIARLNNLSETAFLFPREDPECPYQVIFFTPAHRIAMCGHATLASAFIYWRAQGRPALLRFTQQADVGRLGLEVLGESEGPLVFLEMDRPSLVRNLDRERGRIATALRVLGQDLCQDLPVMVNERGYLFLPLRTLRTLQEMVPDFGAMSALDQELGLHGWYVFSRETIDPTRQIHGRFFAPYFGILEDPVTGTANGYLAAYWLRYLGGQSSGTFRVEQGFEIGRDGLLEVRYDSRDGQLTEVWVGGRASLYLEGDLYWGRENPVQDG
jgi:PhzF family phenazine biosynthesis protein